MEGTFNLLRGLLLAFTDVLEVGENLLCAVIFGAQEFDAGARGLVLFAELPVFAAKSGHLIDELADFVLNVIDFVHIRIIAL